uniref:Uncharacterized protein n=1 Tax=Magallana gigas TaxID=29159 RepID=K1QRQ9_MAGGI
MKTSNSSEHLNGDSMASHNARMKQTVEKDLSPPDSDRKFLAPSPSELCKNVHNRVIMVYRAGGMQHVSESVFLGMCEIVGTSQQVAIRRETMDINEVLVRPHYRVIEMMSGSRKEGFRLKGSDVDTMFWLNSHRVIMAKSQSEYYNTANITLILSDSSKSPPGFTLLQLLKPTKYKCVQSACVRIHIDTTLSQATLDELQVLVHHDRGLYVPNLLRDISWEILGICQQITGNLQAALYSYQQSLTQYPCNKIQTATQCRIQDVASYY